MLKSKEIRDQEWFLGAGGVKNEGDGGGYTQGQLEVLNKWLLEAANKFKVGQRD